MVQVSEPGNGVFGIGEHTDFGMITMMVAVRHMKSLPFKTKDPLAHVTPTTGTTEKFFYHVYDLAASSVPSVTLTQSHAE